MGIDVPAPESGPCRRKDTPAAPVRHPPFAERHASRHRVHTRAASMHTAPAPSPGLESRPAAHGDGGTSDVRWWRALHAYALAVASGGDAEEIWDAAARRLPDLLCAAAVSLSAPGLPGGRARDASESDSALAPAALDAAHRAARECATDPAGAAPSAVPLSADGHRALAAPLPPVGEGAAGGALVAAWAGEPPPGAAERLAAAAAHLSAALAGAARHAAAVEAGLQRDRFFSAMNHDIRTPVTAIIGYGELLHDGIVGELEPRQREMVQRITGLAGHLAQLVGDVLDLARLEAGRLALNAEAVPVADLVAGVVRAVEPRAHGKGLTLRDEAGADRTLRLHADAARLRQILATLLIHAVETTESGAVTVTAREAGGRGWIEVRDTGPGIPAEGQEALFEAFLRTAAGGGPSRDSGGALALAIARRLARAMDGDLVGRGLAGGGAAFTLHLPLQPAQDA
jgi:signal transduction histidine kinase